MILKKTWWDRWWRKRDVAQTEMDLKDTRHNIPSFLTPVNVQFFKKKRKTKNWWPYIYGRSAGKNSRKWLILICEFWTGRSRKGLGYTLWPQYSQPGRWYVADAGHASGYPLAKYWHLFCLGERRTPRATPRCLVRSNTAGNVSPPITRVHLISSRPSCAFISLARQEAAWTWFDSMSRLKVYRHWSCLW